MTDEEMTDKELVDWLRREQEYIPTLKIAADRIERLVKELHTSRMAGVIMDNTVAEAEAKLAKAVEALKNIAHGGGYTDMQIARAVLEELEKTE